MISFQNSLTGPLTVDFENCDNHSKSLVMLDTRVVLQVSKSSVEQLIMGSTLIKSDYL